MSIKKFHYLVLPVIVIAVFSLFTIKERVSTLDYQLSSVVKQINSENKTIHILKAERAYLLSPARLKNLTTAYLELQTVKPYQMVKDPLAPVTNVNIKFDHNISISKSNKWRYKKITNNKYIQTVSSREK
ncbi:MAG: hypothetical protein RCO49_01075 [Rickettsia endosymbiont of Argas persicus]